MATTSDVLKGFYGALSGDATLLSLTGNSNSMGVYQTQASAVQSQGTPYVVVTLVSKTQNLSLSSDAYSYLVDVSTYKSRDLSPDASPSAAAIRTRISTLLHRGTITVSNGNPSSVVELQEITLHDEKVWRWVQQFEVVVTDT